MIMTGLHWRFAECLLSCSYPATHMSLTQIANDCMFDINLACKARMAKPCHQAIAPLEYIYGQLARPPVALLCSDQMLGTFPLLNCGRCNC